MVCKNGMLSCQILVWCLNMFPGPAFGILTISGGMERKWPFFLQALIPKLARPDLQLFFWDNVCFGSGIFVDICSRIVGNLGVDRAGGNLFFYFIEHMDQAHNDNKCLKIQHFKWIKWRIYLVPVYDGLVRFLRTFLLCPLALVYHYPSLARIPLKGSQTKSCLATFRDSADCWHVAWRSWPRDHV